ncbi:uncharacterized protein LOC116249793 [Nymphaea colorata]|nr:uncharacterized protein LOC116249793 [Nymphaea colorata]
MMASGWDSSEEEALSFCNLPLGGPKETSKEPKLPSSDDFEFTSWSAVLLPESDDMCVADDVISDGQLLPFRPPESSGRELLGSAGEPAVPSRCESLDRSWCFTSSKQGNGLCDSEPDRRRASTGSGGFFAMASPKPGMTGGSFPAVVVGRKKEGATKMGLFRLGLVRTPEIELGDLRERVKKKEEMGRSRSGSSSSSSSSLPSSPSSWKVFPQLDCKCSAVDTVSAVITRRKGETRRVREGEDEEEMKIRLLKQKSEASRLRTFEWLNGLPRAR